MQAMASEGTEVIAGGISDPVFGPVVLFGAGGTAAEVWQDRAVALAPISASRAAQLVCETKVHTLLAGYRGAPAADMDALADVLVRVSALLDAHPEVCELDLNPLIAGPDGVQIVDARCRLAPSTTRSGVAARSLD